MKTNKQLTEQLTDQQLENMQLTALNEEELCDTNGGAHYLLAYQVINGRLYVAYLLAN